MVYSVDWVNELIGLIKKLWHAVHIYRKTISHFWSPGAVTLSSLEGCCIARIIAIIKNRLNFNEIELVRLSI